MPSSTITSPQKKSLKSPFSIRFKDITEKKLHIFSKASRRSKASIVDEAVEYYILVQTKKAEVLQKALPKNEFSDAEILQLRTLLDAGYNSGEPEAMPTLEEIKSIAQKKYHTS